MAENSLVLFFIVLGMAGLMEAISYRYDLMSLPVNMRGPLTNKYGDYLRNMREIQRRCNYNYRRCPSNRIFNYVNFIYPDSDNSDDSSKSIVGSSSQINTIDGHFTERPDLPTSTPRSSPLGNMIRIGRTSSANGHSESVLKVHDKKISDSRILLVYTENIEAKKSTSDSGSLQMKDINTIKPEPQGSSFEDKVDLRLGESKNEFITLNEINKGEKMTSDMENKETENVSDSFAKSERIDRIHKDKKDDSIALTTFLENSSSSTNSRTSETERKNTFSSTETSSSKEFSTTSDNKNSQAEPSIFTNHYSIMTRETAPDKSGNFKPVDNTYSEKISDEEHFEKVSIVFQDPISTVGQKDKPFEDKAGSSIFIQPATTERESTVSQSDSFTSPRLDMTSKIKSNSLEQVNSQSTQHFETESYTFHSSITRVGEDTEPSSESSFSLKLESTTSKTVEIKSTPETAILSSKIISTQSTKRATKDNTKEPFSIEPSKIYFPPEGKTRDHTIEIPILHKARIAITSIFLVIALIAIVVLAVYIFRLKRKEVQYDQLRLIP